MNLPKDPYILLSFINTKLRDEYHSLDELCLNLDINKKQLELALSAIQYSYTGEHNRFVSIL
jgi:hypothetical protein